MSGDLESTGNGTEIVKSGSGVPADMIRLAVMQGADLDKLEKLLSLQERFEANEARKAYHAAMSAFKADPPKIDKDKTVGYDSKTGGRVGYKHASLYNVTQKISSSLSRYGLSASWFTKQAEKLISVTTRITHAKGHFEETTLSAEADTSGSKNAIQAIGSTISYLERYGLLAMTGLATFEQDDDGASTECIDEKQQHQIVDMIADTGTSIEKFLKYMGIESIEKLPKAKFQQAVTALENKKKKGGAS